MKGFNKKKLLVFVVVLVLSTLFFGVPAYASDVSAQVDKANTKVDNFITQAQTLADSVPNQEDQFIANLIKQTNQTALQLSKATSQDDCTIGSYYTDVTVGSQTVSVDPFVLY